MAIDLNADLGEMPGATGVDLDAALLSVVSSANVATGGHAGDLDSMLRVCREAVRSGVQVGAHVSYPDRAAFGRRSMALAPPELRATVTEQIVQLRKAADATGARVGYLKPHGALYHDAAIDPALADVLLEIADRAGVAVLTLPGKTLHVRGAAAGTQVFTEGFADRAYRADGNLQPRDRPGALIHDPTTVRTRVVALARRLPFDAVDGQLSLAVDSICLHGDTPGAVELARHVAESLTQAGISIRPFVRS